MTKKEIWQLFNWLEELEFHDISNSENLSEKIYIIKFGSNSPSKFRANKAILVFADIDTAATLRNGSKVQYACNILLISGDTEIDSFINSKKIPSNAEDKATNLAIAKKKIIKKLMGVVDTNLHGV